MAEVNKRPRTRGAQKAGTNAMQVRTQPKGKATGAADTSTGRDGVKIAVPRDDPPAPGGGRGTRPQASARRADGKDVTARAPAPLVGRSRGSRERPRVGLALAGGGPLGAIYEIGALTALSEALEGLDFNDLDTYVGVSSGGFIAAALANGITPAQMCRMFIESDPEADGFEPELLMRPALREYGQRIAALPSLLLDSVMHYLARPWRLHFLESFQRLGRAIPTGIFDNVAIDRYLQRVFTAPGRTNDFRELRNKLFLVAADLDSGESIQFGAAGRDHVPISLAVQASAALPGLYPPVEIDGRYYVDGALKKTLHASVALEQGVQLLLCVNPLVPFDSALAAARGHPNQRRLIEGGLPMVLSQTFRAIIHSRMQAGMGKYATEFRDADVVLFEPNRDDADMFFTNVFSYASRRRLSEHAYQKTRQELYRRRHEIGPTLARHGIRIRVDVLRDASLRLVEAAGLERRDPLFSLKAIAGRLGDSLDDLDGWLAALRKTARRAA
jgi:predicted acylesterase/phospholipase RssA